MFISKAKQKAIAKERILILLSQAEKVFNKNPSLSNRYVALARRISMKAKVSIPKKLKRRFCKYCYSFLVPGKNCVVRTKNRKIVYHCNNCNKIMRFPFLREKRLAFKSKL